MLSLDQGRATLEALCLGHSEDGLCETVAGWLSRRSEVLLAVDAPLGWPVALSEQLARHAAGCSITGAAHSMFRRQTDRFIKERTGKQPLDVGADRIARTAFAALAFLNRLRTILGDEIPLAWDHANRPHWTVIEVYPAATLCAHRMPDREYKKPQHSTVRMAIIRALTQHLDIAAHRRLLESNADALDSLICTLAGLDFIHGCAMTPENSELAQREGWIWARDPTLPCKCWPGTS
jgi:predicted RNase H-like nuclease